MQFRQLRRVIQQVVAASLPVAMTGCLLTEAIDDDDNCYDFEHETLRVAEPADPSMQLKIDSCRADVDACRDLCSEAMSRANIGASPRTCNVTFHDGEVAVRVSYEVFTGGSGCPAEGRRPAGLSTPTSIPARTPAGAWLAQAAWLEAASVFAFHHLAQELEHHGAPSALVKLARAAARDEVRHTAMMAHLARRFGGELPTVDVALPGLRSLEEIAIENAIEGCVRETWGAAVALWQSKRAPDREVRETFAAIAKDEARHAALAWAVDAWVTPLLSEAGRARVAMAREQAAREILEDGAGHLEALVALGLPTGEQAYGLAARTYHSLWNGGLS